MTNYMRIAYFVKVYYAYFKRTTKIYTLRFRLYSVTWYYKRFYFLFCIFVFKFLKSI